MQHYYIMRPIIYSSFLLLSSHSYSITFYVFLLFIPINFSLFVPTYSVISFSISVLLSTPFIYLELVSLSPLKLYLRNCHRILHCSYNLLTLFLIKSLNCSFNYIAEDLLTNWFGMWDHPSGEKPKRLVKSR